MTGKSIMSSIVIASAARTPVGSFNGALSAVAAHDLGAVAIKAALERAGVAPGEVDEVIMGQILAGRRRPEPGPPGGHGRRFPKETTAWGLNQLCGSGLRAVALGMQQIASGDADIIVAGGQESMSMAPHAMHLRGGVKMGDGKMVDTMMYDALTDAFYNYPDGQHRRERRQAVAAHPRRAGRLCGQLAEQGGSRPEGRQVQGRDRAHTIKGRKGDTVVEEDEYIKHGVTVKASPSCARPSTRKAP
jgi:acetyl-CoA C-acetyltransferase